MRVHKNYYEIAEDLLGLKRGKLSDDIKGILDAYDHFMRRSYDGGLGSDKTVAMILIENNIVQLLWKNENEYEIKICEIFEKE